MNWSFVGWVVGGIATIYLCKFLLELLKSLFGKDARRNLIESMGDGIHNANEAITERLREKAEERKRQKEQENRAEVYIR